MKDADEMKGVSIKRVDNLRIVPEIAKKVVKKRGKRP